MEKYVNPTEEIIFLDAEILDDDDDAPVGVLVKHAPIDEVTLQEVAQTDEIEEVPESTDEAAADVATAIVEEDSAEYETVAENPIAEAVAEDPIVEAVKEVEEAEITDTQDVAVAESVKEIENAEPIADEIVKEDEIEESASQNIAEITASETEAQAAEFVKTEEVVQEEIKPSPAKKKSTSKKKPTESDIWGVAEVKVKSDKTNNEEEKPTVAKETKEEKKPVKAEVKKPAAEKAPAVKKATATKATAEKATTEKKTAAAKATATKATEKATATKKPVAAKAATATKAKAEVKEQVIVEGEGKVHGKFVIKKTANGNFVFKLYSSNHRVVAIGAQPYSEIKSCRGGINSVINNAEKAPVENQTLKKYNVEKCPKWEVYTDKKGEFRLRLIASNGNIVATTNDGYVDIGGAKNGISAVARACKGCAIVRNDNLW